MLRRRGDLQRRTPTRGLAVRAARGLAVRLLTLPTPTGWPVEGDRGGVAPCHGCILSFVLAHQFIRCTVAVAASSASADGVGIARLTESSGSSTTGSTAGSQREGPT